MTTLVNIAELPETWRFVQSIYPDKAACWAFALGQPRTALERAIRRPKLARYRAALRGALFARSVHDGVLISHLPHVAAAVNLSRGALCPHVPHLAFSFNFTSLPAGLAAAYFRAALTSIDEFVVFSKYERQLYSETFGIPIERFHHLNWAMETPDMAAENPVIHEGDYLCAVGGEGRDYRLLAEALRGLPAVRMVVVARPYSILGVDFPDNVQVFTNIPSALTWRIAADSRGMAVPLWGETTACGHITIVGSHMLTIPLVVTRSYGTADYVDPSTGLLVEPGSVKEMRLGLQELIEDRAGAQARANVGHKWVQAECTLDSWANYLHGFCRRSRNSSSVDTN